MNTATKFMILVLWLFGTPTLGGNTASTHKSSREQYIVLINKEAPVIPRLAEVLWRVNLHEGHPDVHHIYNNSGFQGFAAFMRSQDVDLLGSMSDISDVEKSTMRSISARRERAQVTWGLQRISLSEVFESDLGKKPLLKNFWYTFQTGPQDVRPGTGADIYILDTGIFTQHSFFQPNRAKMIWSVDGVHDDKSGHGTRVAGIAAGFPYGVASSANLLGVKICKKSNEREFRDSDAIAGIGKVVDSHDVRVSQSPGFLGSVMNLSFGGIAKAGKSDALDKAVQSALDKGIHTVIAAGNSATPASFFSPARLGGPQGDAITVGAVDISNKLWRTKLWFRSNYGEGVDVFAPGVKIMSSSVGDQDALQTGSGTSLAAPFVTGIVAYAMALDHSLAKDVKKMKAWVKNMAVKSKKGLLIANNGVIQKWPPNDDHTRMSPEFQGGQGSKWFGHGGATNHDAHYDRDSDISSPTSSELRDPSAAEELLRHYRAGQGEAGQGEVGQGERGQSLGVQGEARQDEGAQSEGGQSDEGGRYQGQDQWFESWLRWQERMRRMRWLRWLSCCGGGEEGGQVRQGGG